jgi:hypothetical protein
VTACDQVRWNAAPERVRAPLVARHVALRGVFEESDSLGLLSKMGGKYHLKLNNGERPIANKYREGKMKRTLKRELNST